jgi:hypothetical protein
MRSSFVLVLFVLSLLSSLFLTSWDEYVDTKEVVLKRTSTTKVEVQTYFRSPGRSPAIDVVVTVNDPKVQVDSVTLTMDKPVRDQDWVDTCCPWYRAEDMWGTTWQVKRDGASVTLTPTGIDYLTQGTWVVHLHLVGYEIPTVASVSHTERQ